MRAKAPHAFHWTPDQAGRGGAWSAEPRFTVGPLLTLPPLTGRAESKRAGRRAARQAAEEALSVARSHDCDRPDPKHADHDRWTCPVCGREWKRSYTGNGWYHFWAPVACSRGAWASWAVHEWNSGRPNAP